MPIEVTVRHRVANEALQSYAERKAGEILDEFPQVEFVHVILDVEKRSHVARVLVQGRRHLKEEVVESAAHMQAAVDAATDKTLKLLRRIRERVHDHKLVMKKAEGRRVTRRGTGA